MISPSKIRNHNKENACESPKKLSLKEETNKAFHLTVNSSVIEPSKQSNRKDALCESLFFLQNLKPMTDINTSFDEEVPDDECEKSCQFALGPHNF